LKGLGARRVIRGVAMGFLGEAKEKGRLLPSVPLLVKGTKKKK